MFSPFLSSTTLYISYGFLAGIRQFSSGFGALRVEKVYLDLDDTKVIFEENIRRPGIYRWVNLINGSRYIGSAADLTRRFRDYFSTKWLEKETLKNNSIIYRALLKYGYSNFRLEILEYCEKAKILEREQYYLDVLKPTYNICEVAGSSLGRITNNSTRLKLKYVWMVRLFKEKNNSLSEQINFTEFILNCRRLRTHEKK